MREFPIFEPGESITIQRNTGQEDAANHYGTGKLSNLLATPALVALMIEGATHLIDSKLSGDLVSVGKNISVNHEAPTYIGEMITCKVIVESQVGNRVTINIEAYDEHGLIGTGHAERYIVHHDLVTEKANTRMTSK